MTAQAFRDLLKLGAAGNSIFVHSMIGIFESLDNSLRLTEVPDQWFPILLLTICLFIFYLCLCIKHFLSIKPHLMSTDLLFSASINNNKHVTYQNKKFTEF